MCAAHPRVRLEEAVRAFNTSLLEHRNPDTLKRLNDTEKLMKVRARAGRGGVGGASRASVACRAVACAHAPHLNTRVWRSVSASHATRCCRSAVLQRAHVILATHHSTCYVSSANVSHRLSDDSGAGRALQVFLVDHLQTSQQTGFRSGVHYKLPSAAVGNVGMCGTWTFACTESPHTQGQESTAHPTGFELDRTDGCHGRSPMVDRCPAAACRWRSACLCLHSKRRRQVSGVL